MIGINEIKMQLDIAEKEITSLENGRKASAARARKSLQIIKGLAHTLSKNIVEYAKGLPVKTRSGEVPAEAAEAAEPIAPKRKRATKKEISV